MIEELHSELHPVGRHCVDESDELEELDDILEEVSGFQAVEIDSRADTPYVAPVESNTGSIETPSYSPPPPAPEPGGSDD
jgi:hypothetical protein